MKKLLPFYASVITILLCLNSYAQGQKPRLVAQSERYCFGSGFEKTDSISYQYTSDRQYDSNAHEWKYTTEKQISYDRNGNAALLSIGRQQFDVNDNITEQLYQIWDTATRSWNSYSRISFTYSGNNKTSRTVAQYNDFTKTWKDVYREEWSYGAGSQPEVYVTKYPDNISGVLVEKNKTEYSYTGNQLVQSLLYEWQGQWQLLGRTIFNYSGTLLASETSEHWDASTSSFKFSGQTVYTYNTNGDLIEKAGNGNTRLYAYDSNHNRITEISPGWTRINRWYNKYGQITRELIDYWDGNKWEISCGDGTDQTYDAHYYYQEVGTVVDELRKGSSIIIYPSIATDIIHIKADFAGPQNFTVTIYDMTGRLVKSWAEAGVTDYPKAIDISLLSPGQYILNLRGGGINLSARFGHIE